MGFHRQSGSAASPVDEAMIMTLRDRSMATRRVIMFVALVIAVIFSLISSPHSQNVVVFAVGAEGILLSAVLILSPFELELSPNGVTTRSLLVTSRIGWDEVECTVLQQSSKNPSPRLRVNRLYH